MATFKNERPKKSEIRLKLENSGALFLCIIEEQFEMGE